MALVCSGLLGTGCFDEPPEYTRGEQIPPFIVHEQVIPSLATPLVVTPGAVLDFSLPYNSIDQEDLYWFVFFDRPPGGRGTVIDGERAPGEPDKPFTFEREVNFALRFDPSIPLGCHTLSFVIAHEHNWLDPESYGDGQVLLSEDEAGKVLWFLDFVPAEQTASSALSSCPRAGSQ